MSIFPGDDQFAGFCLVSSDSDFTRLAARIRESGLRVYGFGERKTPRPFVSACDRFIYTEVFSETVQGKPETAKVSRTEKELRSDTGLLNLIRSAIDAASDDAGWAPLGTVGSYINKTATDFDSRNYGFGKLNELVAAIGLFELERRETHFYVRDSRRKSMD